MTITANAARDRFVVRCDDCGFTHDLAVGDLTDGGIRHRGWRPRGPGGHQCPDCQRQKTEEVA